MLYDARKERYEVIECFGKKCLFTDIRLDRNTVPKELFVYEIRHDDEGWGDPVELARGIMVNFLGTVISRTELLEGCDRRYFSFDKDDDPIEWKYLEDHCTLSEFVESTEPTEKELEKRLLKHVGHSVRICVYGEDDVVLECEDCNEIILDSELYTICARKEVE